MIWHDPHIHPIVPNDDFTPVPQPERQPDWIERPGNALRLCIAGGVAIGLMSAIVAVLR